MEFVIIICRGTKFHRISLRHLRRRSRDIEDNEGQDAGMEGQEEGQKEKVRQGDHIRGDARVNV